MRTKIYPAPAAPSTKIDGGDLAARLGLHRAGRGWRGDCPLCGYRGSLALDVRGNQHLIWCSNCADRAGLARLLRAEGVPHVPPPAERLPRAAPDATARIARAAAIWRGAEPIEPGSPAAKYLENRRISHAMNSAALRWRPDVPHPAGGRRIALLAAVTAPDGSFAGVQRVFVKPDGRKADIEPAKASLGVVAGGACRLADPEGGALVIGEGVETSAAAGAILGLPAWSAISAGNLGRSLILPPAIRSVVIAVDHDMAGQAAAREAWRRWTREGRHVRLATPRKAGSDFADLAMGGVR